MEICLLQVNTQISPLRGASNFFAIIFNKIPIHAEVGAHFYVILDNYPCFWVRTRHVSFRTSKEHVKLLQRSKFKTDNYQTQIDLWQTVCLPLKNVLNTYSHGVRAVICKI